jgi:type I restriction enzyme, S subunit
MAKWIDCTLSDLGTIIGGATPSTKMEENYQNGHIPWITPKDLSVFRGRYISHGERNITQQGLKSCSTQLLPKHSILFSSRAPIGYIAIAECELCTNQGFKSIVPNERTDYMFLYYLLKFNKNAIENMGSGTTFKEVSGSTMKSIPVRVPVSIEEQKRIASTLSALDDKIEENDRINCNLQNQAQALFKSWFIDFEPFGGSAPSEWCESTFGQIAVLKTDSWSPTKNPNELIEHYSIPALDEQHYPVFETSSDIKSNKYIINSNSVMISKLNPDTKRIWRPLCITDNSVCSTEFIVFEARKKEHKDFVYSILDSTPFLNYLCSHTTGSTNSRQRANPKSTLDYSLLLPPDTVVNDFCHIVTPMYDLINANIIENQELSKTRDILLPKLMTGEIDVSKLEL